MTLLSDFGMTPMMDRKGSGMNRAFSAGTFGITASWGAAPGCYERCAFGANHEQKDVVDELSVENTKTNYLITADVSLIP